MLLTVGPRSPEQGGVHFVALYRYPRVYGLGSGGSGARGLGNATLADVT